MKKIEEFLMVFICVLLSLVFAMGIFSFYKGQQLVSLQIAEKCLQVEKLKYELSIYREQESISANAE